VGLDGQLHRYPRCFKIEAQKVSKRTKAGLERARRRGARIGRPQLQEGLRSEITQRLADGATPFAGARALGIDRKTVIKNAGHLPHHNGNAEATAAELGVRTGTVQRVKAEISA